VKRRKFIKTSIITGGNLGTAAGLMACNGWKAEGEITYLSGGLPPREIILELEARKYAGMAGQLARAINHLFWDEDVGAYSDGFRNGEKLDSHYPISSIYPLLLGISEPKKEKDNLRHLERELRDIGEETRNRRMTPFGSFYLFSALYRTGNAALAERFLIQYWPRMIHQGDDTSWENFDISGEKRGQGTASHAWSGHPTFFMSTEILGVTLGFNHDLDPGLILLCPQSETLSWARGTVSHPAGNVTVDWKIEGEFLQMEVELPEGVPYLIEPWARLAGYDLRLTVHTHGENNRPI
jgi:hypothetical protein